MIIFSHENLVFIIYYLYINIVLLLICDNLLFLLMLQLFNKVTKHPPRWRQRQKANASVLVMERETDTWTRDILCC